MRAGNNDNTMEKFWVNNGGSHWRTFSGVEFVFLFRYSSKRALQHDEHGGFNGHADGKGSKHVSENDARTGQGS